MCRNGNQDEAYRGGTSDDEDPKRKRKSKQTSVVPTKKQRKQSKQTSVVARKGKRKTKSKLKMDAKTYTVDSVLEKFDDASEYGQATSNLHHTST
jgi:hypothetical protein